MPRNSSTYLSWVAASGMGYTRAFVFGYVAVPRLSIVYSSVFLSAGNGRLLHLAPPQEPLVKFPISAGRDT